MKKLLLALLLTTAFVACQMTPQKVAVVTLTDIGLTANSSYEAYLQLVLQGNLPTNSVPLVTRYYRDFQTSFGVACSAARFATNSTFANPELQTLFTKLETAIQTAKGGK